MILDGCGGIQYGGTFERGDMKVLFVASEGLPFSKTGGLADVMEALPRALVSLGHEVAVLLPRYRNTKVGAVAAPGLSIPMGDALRFPAILDGVVLRGVRYYFVEDPEYFDRDQLYGVSGKDYPDNAERFAEFCRAAIEFSKHVWTPEVIHCHDWQSALVPVLLRTQYGKDATVQGLPVIFTIHNMGYHGTFPREIMKKLGLPENLYRVDAMEFYGRVNFLKGALVFADFLTTVSRKYAEEIQTPEYGHGLDGVGRSRADRLTGILNGVDYEPWDPSTDKLIAANYSPDNLKGKMLCKKALLERMGARQPVLNRPVIGVVSRFDRQKGFDLIADIAEQLMSMSLYIVALGTGDPTYEEFFRAMAAKYPDKFLVKVAYDNTLAHQIEAGSDMFLMPSRYEPCGLNQIYSMKYGAVPIVRATGGLDDTVELFDGRNGTGFKFSRYSPDALLSAIREAVETYHRPALWGQLMHNCMHKDFSWAVSAAEYAKIYERQRKLRLEPKAAPHLSAGASEARLAAV